MQDNATLAQAIKFLTLIEQDGTPCEQLQNVLASGLFSDLLHTNFTQSIDRGAVREALGIISPSPKQEVVQPPPTPTILWAIEDDGRTNEELVAALAARLIEVSDYTKEIVAKANEPVPPKGTIYRFVGIKGAEWTTDKERTTKAIFAKAASPECNYSKPSLRAGLLLREKFSQEQLGYPYVAVMNEPVRDSDGNPRVLGLDRGGDEDWLDAWDAFPGRQWSRGRLFLGWVHFPDHRVLRSATKLRMVKRVAENPTPETLASYRGMLSHGNAQKIEQSTLEGL